MNGRTLEFIRRAFDVSGPTPSSGVLEIKSSELSIGQTRKDTLMRRSPPGEGKKIYDVGKGRPPKSTRWKPGQSGNPRGRPKGAKNLISILSDALDEKVEVQDRGKVRHISKREAIVKRLVYNAAKGDLRTAAFLLAYEPEIVRKAKTIPRITPAMSPIEAANAYAELVKGEHRYEGED